MEHRWKYALEEDIKCAIEIAFEPYPDLWGSRLFGLETALSVVNIGCIEDTNRVLVMGSRMEMITALVSYMYSPRNIRLWKPAAAWETLWAELNQLLAGCRYTEPVSCQGDSLSDAEEDHACYDVAIVGNAEQANPLDQELMERFHLETGEECNRFELLLLQAAERLAADGRLVLLAKPGWILKLWPLLQELELQLEYEGYRYEPGRHRHPNAFLWLRFIKRAGSFDEEKQRRNLLSLMEDSLIDRLFAHRNDLRFPYVELSYSNAESYVSVEQQAEYLQYFFSLETTASLAELCTGYTACLVTPSIAQYAHRMNRSVVLFERDNRFRENGGVKYVKYDLNKGLTKLLHNKYAKSFDRVICDPPFDIKLEQLAADIDELMKQARSSEAYVVFPSKRKSSLLNAMKGRGLLLREPERDIVIEYARPPKLVRVEGKAAIRLYRFAYGDMQQ